MKVMLPWQRKPWQLTCIAMTTSISYSNSPVSCGDGGTIDTPDIVSFRTTSNTRIQRDGRSFCALVLQRERERFFIAPDVMKFGQN